jgi:1-acyl-sn-glycerol-3-phosphate acyltransferase
MLRPIFVFATFAVSVCCLIAVQWTLAALKLPGWRPVALAYYKFLCALLRVRVRAVGEPVRDGRVLILANHASWLDILVIGSVIPAAFVAKREVRSWPLVGKAAALQHTIFVDRSRRQQTAAANAEIAARLADGDPVVLFAEGTSSDGNRVLAFRSALVGAANDMLSHSNSNGPLSMQPLSICYTGLEGLPMGRQHRPVVAWYGDLDFMPHFKQFVRRGAVDAVVTFGAPVALAADMDRKEIVRSMERTVRGLTAATLRGRPVPIAAE